MSSDLFRHERIVRSSKNCFFFLIINKKLALISLLCQTWKAFWNLCQASHNPLLVCYIFNVFELDIIFEVSNHIKGFYFIYKSCNVCIEISRFLCHDVHCINQDKYSKISWEISLVISYKEESWIRINWTQLYLCAII